jgi:hypothetical protein
LNDCICELSSAVDQIEKLYKEARRYKLKLGEANSLCKKYEEEQGTALNAMEKEKDKEIDRLYEENVNTLSREQKGQIELAKVQAELFELREWATATHEKKYAEEDAGWIYGRDINGSMDAVECLDPASVPWWLRAGLQKYSKVSFSPAMGTPRDEVKSFIRFRDRRKDKGREDRGKK